MGRMVIHISTFASDIKVYTVGIVLNITCLY